MASLKFVMMSNYLSANSLCLSPWNEMCCSAVGEIRSIGPTVLLSWFRTTEAMYFIQHSGQKNWSMIKFVSEYVSSRLEADMSNTGLTFVMFLWGEHYLMRYIAHFYAIFSAYATPIMPLSFHCCIIFINLYSSRCEWSISRWLLSCKVILEISDSTFSGQSPRLDDSLIHAFFQGHILNSSHCPVDL